MTYQVDDDEYDEYDDDEYDGDDNDDSMQQQQW